MNLSTPGIGLANLSRLSDGETRSICPENPTGSKGGAAKATTGVASEAAEGLGVGWKIAPFVVVPAGETFDLANIDGQGAIQQIWLTPALAPWRHLILRMYWDGQPTPSVECPLGDFFAAGWGGHPWSPHSQVTSLPVCVNPGSAFNCYWEMPFREGCRITLENVSAGSARIYYQINYSLFAVDEAAAYFHAQFRRSNPLAEREVHTIVDGVQGSGHYVGTYVAWGANNNGWWGEGEVKFYLDGDDQWPTIASTGTEDYFGGSYNFWVKGRYQSFTTPYAGLSEVYIPDGKDVNVTQSRFGMYRWHLTDPIRFKEDLRVTMQALGWRADRRYLPLQDDISSVAFWYQALPTRPFPPLLGPDALEII